MLAAHGSGCPGLRCLALLSLATSSSIVFLWQLLPLHNMPLTAARGCAPQATSLCIRSHCQPFMVAAVASAASGMAAPHSWLCVVSNQQPVSVWHGLLPVAMRSRQMAKLASAHQLIEAADSHCFNSWRMFACLQKVCWPDRRAACSPTLAHAQAPCNTCVRLLSRLCWPVDLRHGWQAASCC